MATIRFDIQETEIIRLLAAAHPDTLPPENQELQNIFSDLLRPAAVLLPLLRKEDGWHLLFTRRTDDLAEHSGQVSFPGGRSDSTDNGPEQTALREAREEIGLNPADVHILGRLRRSLTITHYLVTPVVGVMPWPYLLRLGLDEVSRAFTIPLEWLANPANRELHQRTLSTSLPPIPLIYYQPYDGEVLWGASARFTINLLDILFGNELAGCQ
jgi:8-oxo-dGTP pyrophosphatase MutT (NUDIX family)